MPLLPYWTNGRIRLAMFEAGAVSGEEVAAFAEEQARIQEVLKRRLYYAGEQYDNDNLNAALAAGISLEAGERLPEHERLNAYSTQIAESVDFLADQLSEGFAFEAAADQVQQVLSRMVEVTEALSGGDEDEEMSVDDLLTEALIAGDVAYEMKWDPVEATVYPEFWESECVWFDVPFGSKPRKVVRTEIRWVDDPALGGEGSKQVTERIVYAMHVNPAGYMECRRDVFWDSDEAPRESEWLGLPMIPWRLLRANKRGLRVFRGQSVIKDRAMDNADRYDAVEQTSWLIARYNSHGNLVVVGDAATIELKAEGGVKKDVADVLTFPGGTSAQAIALPTDPEMIEHQRKVTSDAIYATFGLVRVEPDTLGGLGGVSGYALEILNRKTEGTFRRVRRQWIKDWLEMVNMALDVQAYKEQAVFGVLNPETMALLEADLEDPDFVLPEGALPVVMFWNVDPAAVYPNRECEIRLGSGYIVDDVMVRDDFTANLYSREFALRQRGISPDDIAEIEDQISEQKQTEGTTIVGVPTVPAGTQAPTLRSTARGGA